MLPKPNTGGVAAEVELATELFNIEEFPPNENVEVGAGDFISVGLVEVATVVLLAPPNANIPVAGCTGWANDEIPLIAADVMDEVVLLAVGDFGKENIPGIDDLAAKGAAVVASALLLVLAATIGVIPVSGGIAAPNLNPGDAVLFSITTGAVEVTAGLVVVLLKVNIAAVGELNPLFSAVVAVVVAVLLMLTVDEELGGEVTRLAVFSSAAG